MYYDGKEFLKPFIESFDRMGRENVGKRGLVLPNMEDMVRLENEIMALFFPGLSGGEDSDELISTIHYHYDNVAKLLQDAIFLALTYEDKGKSNKESIEKMTKDALDKLFKAPPSIRFMLKLDAKAALDGDPAAKNLHEVILSYPSMKALSIHRVSHFLYASGIPLIPRMLNEIMHRETGIDIHPGAEIGKSFFIDHGTGTVIGETTVIGDNVKLYQGVTLGALSFPKNSCGNLIKGAKRHPTLEDGVTVYANATILGDVRIGKNSIIGSSAWISEDIPRDSLVYNKRAEVKIRPIRRED